MKTRKLKMKDYRTIIHALNILRRDIEYMRAGGRVSGIYAVHNEDLKKTISKVERLYYFGK